MMKSNHILVPIALFASLSGGGLDTINEGLWGHWIFKLIRIYIGSLKTRNFERKSNVRAGLLARKNETAVIMTSCV